MQTFQNDSSTAKRKGFLFYSLNLQRSSSESLCHVCSDPNTAHRSTPLQPAEWNVHWCEETQISKSSCQLGMLIRKIFKYWPSSITKNSKPSMTQTKDTNLLIQSPATDLSSDQGTVLPLNALQWRVCLWTAANHILQIDVNWHPSVHRKKREPLAREINSCNSILCFRAHTGPHKHCQIIFCGPILYSSSICAADVQEFYSCLATMQLISTYEGHAPHR